MTELVMNRMNIMKRINSMNTEGDVMNMKQNSQHSLRKLTTGWLTLWVPLVMLMGASAALAKVNIDNVKVSTQGGTPATYGTADTNITYSVSVDYSGGTSSGATITLSTNTLPSGVSAKFSAPQSHGGNSDRSGTATFALTMSTTTNATAQSATPFTVTATSSSSEPGHSNHSGPGYLTINKANAAVVVAPYTVTYDGNPHTAAVTSIAGVNGETGGTVGTVALITTHTAAATYSSDSWSFTGTANYNNIAATTIIDTINKLPVALSGSRTYEGTANAAYGILSVANKVGSDAVTVASGSGTLASANAGAQAITSFGTLALGGAAVGNYTLAGASGSVTINKAISTTVVTITGSPFTYTGSAITPATVSVTGAGLSLTPAPDYANNVNAGSATASYTYAGDVNHAGSSDSKTFTIGQASSTTVVTISGSPFTYSGSAITPATVSVTGAGLGLTPAPVYANNIDAGSATASYTYAGDVNHAGSSDSKTFTIGQASSTTVVTITGSPFTYSGSAITPATVSVTGAGLSLTPAPVYANNIDAGSATASYTYAGDVNHAGSSDSKTFTIGQASSTTVVTISGSPFTYSGSAITPATVSVTGAGALSLTPVPVYANNIDAGTATASYAYAGDANHESSSDSKTFTIGKATPIVTTWPTASVITYGDTLDKSALSGGVPADGGFAFTTPAIVPNAGTNSESVTYTPLDTANYDAVSGSVDVTVYEKLSGSITLYNYLGGEGAKVTVVFVARDSDGNEVGRDEVELDAPAGNPVSYAIGVPVGTATLSAKPRFFLRQKTSVTAGNTAGLDSNFVEFVGGDADNNNQVDGTDYAWLRACWNQSGPLAPNDINGDEKINALDFPDFNGDGNINALDYEVLKHGWYQKGFDE